MSSTRTMVLLIGFCVNLAVYSLVTTYLLYEMGAVGIQTFYSIPVMAWGISPLVSYFCQFCGIFVGLLCSAIPIRFLRGKWSR